MTERFNQRMGGVLSTGRTRDEFARFFAGLDLVDPGIVPTPQWRPDHRHRAARWTPPTPRWPASPDPLLVDSAAIQGLLAESPGAREGGGCGDVL